MTDPNPERASASTAGRGDKLRAMRRTLGAVFIAAALSACGSPASPAPVLPATAPAPAARAPAIEPGPAHVFEMPALPFSFAVPAELAGRTDDERALYAAYTAAHTVDGEGRFEAHIWPYGATFGLEVVNLVTTDDERSFGTLLVHREGDAFRFVVATMTSADEGAELAIASCDAEGRAAWHDDEARASLASHCRSLVRPAVASLLARATGDSLEPETRAFTEVVLAFANPPTALADEVERSVYRFRPGARFVPFHVARDGDVLHVTGTGSMPNRLESLRLDIEPERITLRRDPMAEARRPSHLQ